MMRKLFKKKDEGKIDTRAWKAHLKCVFSTVFYDFFFFLYFLFWLYMRRESIMLYPTAQQCVEPDQRERSIILFKCHEIKAISQFFKHLWILLAFYMRWTIFMYVFVCFSKDSAHNHQNAYGNISMLEDFLNFYDLYQMSISISITLSTTHLCRIVSSVISMLG